MLSTQASSTFPEICFNTPAGRICFPITTGPTFPPPPTSVPEAPSNWNILYSPQGEVIRAASCSGADELLFVNRIERSAEATTKTFQLRRNGELFLTLNARTYHAPETERSQCAKKLGVSVRTDLTDYKITIAQESCSTARVVVDANGTVTERNLDFLDVRCTPSEAPIGLCHALSERDKQQLEPFKALLAWVNALYWKRGAEELAQLSTLLKNPADGGTQASIWCGLARAGCWGLAAAGGAACCGVTAGVGCILCSGGFGAAGSGCSEAWSWC
ncbi:MAG: hypothetical protein V4812_14245 [Pseudomonadota bacterium]